MLGLLEQCEEGWHLWVSMHANAFRCIKMAPNVSKLFDIDHHMSSSSSIIIYHHQLSCSSSSDNIFHHLSSHIITYHRSYIIYHLIHLLFVESVEDGPSARPQPAFGICSCNSRLCGPCVSFGASWGLDGGVVRLAGVGVVHVDRCRIICRSRKGIGEDSACTCKT